MRHEYEIRQMKCNQLLSVLCEKYKVKYVPHTNPSQIHFGDGVHLSKDGGIALYVRNLKEILNPLLGVKNEQRNEPRNNNPMRNRNMRNNYDGQYRNNQIERQSYMYMYNRFNGVVIGDPITTITVIIGKIMNFIRTMIVIIHIIKIST